MITEIFQFLSLASIIVYNGILGPVLVPYQTFPIPKKIILQFYRGLDQRQRIFTQASIMVLRVITLLIAWDGSRYGVRPPIVMGHIFALAILEVAHNPARWIFKPQEESEEDKGDVGGESQKINGEVGREGKREEKSQAKEKEKEKEQKEQEENDVWMWTRYFKNRGYLSIWALATFIILIFGNLDKYGDENNFACVCFFFSGLFIAYSYSCTYIDLPVWLSEVPQYACEIFKNLYPKAATFMPIFVMGSILTSTIYLFLDYDKHLLQHMVLFVCLLSNLPYTTYIIQPTNKLIFEVAGKPYDKQLTKQLFSKWKKLSLGRPILASIGLSQFVIYFLWSSRVEQ